jgi:nuclear transport factor 2 (NTF2) superfamily protein
VLLTDECPERLMYRHMDFMRRKWSDMTDLKTQREFMCFDKNSVVEHMKYEFPEEEINKHIEYHKAGDNFY